MNAGGGRLADLIGAHFDGDDGGAPRPIGVAVSGGGDSVALLLLLHQMAVAQGRVIQAATVDHGLRAEAAAEAAGVADLCAGLGISHRTLRWVWDGQGNLPDRARRGRMTLLAAWAHEVGLRDVALGHTSDDQAETLLMRLARGSGVDGLSCMPARRDALGVTWHRPLLAAGRGELRAFLSARGIGWVDDPSNEDPGYDRVKARQALAVLEPLGLTVPVLVQTAERMALARAVLDDAVLALAGRAVTVQAGDVLIDRRELAQARTETRMRLLSGAMRWITTSDYRPRWQALVAAYDAVCGDRAHALAGCLFLPTKTHLRLTREYQAVRDATSMTDDLWDGRWRLNGPHTTLYQVRATGEDGLAQCPDWRAGGLPHRAAIATPSVWDDRLLVAAPLLERNRGLWQATLAPERADFPDYLITH